MFEILRVYEIAKNELGVINRFIYTNYLKIELKKSFFNKFKGLIERNMPIDYNLITELVQFYWCTINDANVNRNYTHINQIYSNGMIEVKTNERTTLIRLYNETQVSITIKKLNDEVLQEDTIEVDITTIPKSVNNDLLIAIYNYCVSYVYGNKSNLYI